MKCTWGNLLPLVVLVTLGVTASPPAARGGFQTIGDFSSGLDGWTTNDSTAVSLTAVPGSVTLGVSQIYSETDLDLLYMFPAKAQTLSFTITGLTTDPPSDPLLPGFVVTPNAFNAAILDSTGTSAVVPPVDPSTTDAYYTRDLTPTDVFGNTTFGLQATGVQFSTPGGAVLQSDPAVDPSTGALPASSSYTVTVNVSSLAGLTDLVNFRLLSGNDGNQNNSSVSIANVTVETTDMGGGGPTAPVPPTIVLAGVGLLCLAGRGWLSRRGKP